MSYRGTCCIKKGPNLFICSNTVTKNSCGINSLIVINMKQSVGIWLFLALGLFFCLFTGLGDADSVTVDSGDVNLSELRAFDLLCKCETGCIVNTVSLSSSGN